MQRTNWKFITFAPYGMYISDTEVGQTHPSGPFLSWKDDVKPSLYATTVIGPSMQATMMGPVRVPHLDSSKTGEPCTWKLVSTVRREAVGKVPVGNNLLATRWLPTLRSSRSPAIWDGSRQARVSCCGGHWASTPPRTLPSSRTCF